MKKKVIYRSFNIKNIKILKGSIDDNDKKGKLLKGRYIIKILVIKKGV